MKRDTGRALKCARPEREGRGCDARRPHHRYRARLRPLVQPAKAKAMSSAPASQDARAAGQSVLLQRIAELERQRDRLRSRLNHTTTSRAYWRERAKAAEFTPARSRVALELDFLRRENARLKVRVDTLRSVASWRDN